MASLPSLPLHLADKKKRSKAFFYDEFRWTLNLPKIILSLPEF